MRIEIDWTRCDGHGLCAELLPERILLDEWGYPLLRPGAVNGAELPGVRRTVAACPALALRLERENTTVHDVTSAAGAGGGR